MVDTAAKRTIETRTVVFTVNDNRWVDAVIKPGAEIDLAEAKENIAAVVELVGQKKHTLLVDARRIKRLTGEARRYKTDPENRKGLVAQAFLIASNVSRVIVNFVLEVSRPTIPMKMFTDMVEAVAWLRGFDVSDSEERGDGWRGRETDS